MFKVERNASGVVEVVIQNDPVNAFDIPLLDGLAALLTSLSDDADARVVLLRAEGRGFCAGGDVKEVQALPGFEGILGQAQGSLRLIMAVLDCAVPVVVAVHNYCVGIGVLLAGAADVVLAAENTRFVLAEIDNGATAGGVMALRLMPEKRARAAMMTAEPVMAEELHRLGTVLEVTPAAELRAAALRVAGKIGAKRPDAMRRLKRSMNNSFKVAEIEAAYRAELSYTYELNIMGVASAGRAEFLEGARKSYVPQEDGAADLRPSVPQ